MMLNETVSMAESLKKKRSANKQELKVVKE